MIIYVCVYIQCSVIIQIFHDLPPILWGQRKALTNGHNQRCNERRFFTRFHLKSKALHSIVLVEHGRTIVNHLEFCQKGMVYHQKSSNIVVVYYWPSLTEVDLP